MYKCGEFLHICPGQNFMPIKFEKGREIRILREGKFACLMGLSGVKIHFAMNIGTRFVGRRRGHAQVDVLGRW